MQSDYDAWLRAEGYDPGTVTAQLHRVGRVEQYLGDVDRHYAQDQLAEILQRLQYSAEDERRGRPNPTPIPISGILRTNLASYRNAISRYARFRRGGTGGRAKFAGANEAPAAALERAPTPSRKTLASQLATRVEHARTLAEFGFDGEAALAALIAASRYRTLAQAVASLALFSHPETVSQTGAHALFPTIRGAPGQYVESHGRRLMLDDNKSPTDAFLWSNGINRRGRDTQFNHVYSASGDADAYTALPNIVMTPAFLAKLTDTNAEVRALLAWRSYDLYGWKPDSADQPDRPASYSTLEWAVPLPPVIQLKSRLEVIMARRPKDRTVIAARRLGWLFGSPDLSVAR